ncbi:tyrosine-type recombinase/integrase [Paraburkholderia sp. A1RI-2L]|uniref:tyrosine-type recombinase/integrase n=1 Tax=Paraburkholderia sp. A1RI-2L TaxID=3028367 RepID=UPI003B7C5AFB
MLERYQRHLFLYRKADGESRCRVARAAAHAGAGVVPWLVKQHRILSNPAADLGNAACAKTPATPHPECSRSRADPERTARGDTLLGLRDRAMLETLYSTGVRRAELVSLEVGDIDPERALMVRQGKGQARRLIPIGERALAWIGSTTKRGRSWSWAMADARCS